MKRQRVAYLVLAVVAILFSAPVSADDRSLEERVASLEKTFAGIKIYGSMRLSTFYSDADTGPGTDDQGLKWDLQSNSRIGATVTKDRLTGSYELGVDDDASVSTRKLFGIYDMGWGSVLVGQNNPILGNMFYSNQVFFDDLDLCGWGAIFETRLPQVKLKVKGLEIALLEDKASSALNAATGTGNSGDVDVLMPKLEVGYHIDQPRFFADVFGGAFSFKVEDVTLNSVAYGDETVNCWVAGVGGGLQLDPAYVKVQGYYAHNGKNFGIIQQDAVGAQLDASGSVVNETNVGTHLVVGSTVGTCTVEAGFGYAYSQLEDPVGAYGDDKNTCMSYYLNVVVPVYGRFFIVPEVGVLDYGDNSFGDDEEKSTWYAGAKWQIDF